MSDLSDGLIGFAEDVPAGGMTVMGSGGPMSSTADAFSVGLDWLKSTMGDLFSTDAQAAEAAGAGLGVGAETGPAAQSAIDAANAGSAEPSISSAEWFKRKMGDLAEWAKSDKGNAAIGLGLAAAAKYAGDRKRDKILEKHYQEQDALLAQKQNNAMTSGQNLNVNGLGGGIINTAVPGGFNDRRARNLGAKA